jgi:proteasome lid subunit RPN8/RPN11
VIDVILTAACSRKLRRELLAAGSNEIGGVLAAEQVGDGRFVVRAISVQRNGSYASFRRDPEQHRAFIRRFSVRTGNDPERFNYLGEWHSHPSFVAMPSGPDLQQMQALIEETEQTSTFLVLLVIKLAKDGELCGSAHAFRRRVKHVRVRLKAQGRPVQEEAPTLLARLSRRHHHQPR